MSAVVFLSFGLLYLIIGASLGLRGLPLTWLGASLCVVGIAYLRGAPGLLGKRRDGRFHPAALALHAPFIALSWFSWLLRRHRTRKTPWHEVGPGLFLGRMASPDELPKGALRVVDLTSELPPPPTVRRGRYECLPTLDGCAPEPRAFWLLARELAAEPGPVFIHCAAGRGRSATLAAAVLIRRGIASNGDDAVERLQRVRAEVRLSASQRALLSSRPDD